MPGKFRNKTDEQYWTLALDGPDEQIGDVQSCHAWEALLIDCDDLPHAHAIVATDSQGFVDVETFDTQWQAMREWTARKLVHEQPGGCCAESADEH
jgi:hypothetical protein